MTSLDVRSNSAVMKRAEQLKRWEESETNREPPTPRPERGRKIKFSSGCVFLAACLAGDKEEVLKLLEVGADINTANVDGLTALHQACIDDNLEMVEFLVEHRADINRQDNEGWTPLHATASCGFVSIARYLVEHGADVAAVNSDGDLAVDLAVDIQHLPMIDFMQKVVNEHKIDCEKARQAEEQLMLNDAKMWLRSDASEVDRPHPKSGATALHVAAAKGYTKVLSLLLAGRPNVDRQDNDGWTALHAASHWGQKEAAEMLVDAMADMDIHNYAGQTCIDVADRKMVKFLEELRANNKRMKRRPPSQIRISDTIENHIDKTAKIIRVEVKPNQTAKEQANAASVSQPMECAEHDGHNLTRILESDETDSELTDSTESSHSTSLSEAEDDKPRSLTDTLNTQTTDAAAEEEAPWRRNSLARQRAQNDSPTINHVPESKASNTSANSETSDVILRRTQSFENDEKFYQKYHELRARIKATSCPTLPATQISNINNNSNSNSNSNNLSNPINALACDHTNATTTNTTSTATTTTYSTISSTNQNYTVQRSASLKDYKSVRKPTSPTTSPASTVTTTVSTTSSSITSSSAATTPIRSTPSPQNNHVTTATNTTNTAKNNNGTKQSPPSPSTPEAAKQKMSAGTIFKNFFKSFVPPVRDEESETQRKAHAKRVRETRRSTQGVTLDEIKSAEELVKKKNLGMNNNNNSSSNETQTATTTTAPISTSQQLEQEQAQLPTTPSPSEQEKQQRDLEQQQPPPPTSPPPRMSESPITTISADELLHSSAEQKRQQQFAENNAEDEDGDDDDDDITATFTIVAPVLRTHTASLTATGDDDDDDSEVSASFTMTSRRESRSPTPTPTETVETTIVVTPPEIGITEPSHTEDAEARTKLNETTSYTSTQNNQENDEQHNENQKTDLPEELTRTAILTVATAKPLESPTSERAMRGTCSFAPLPLQAQELTAATSSGGHTPAGTPTLDSPVRLREKRSLFDLDNASSLTLAEKLRHEANKYSQEEQRNAAEAATSDSDRDSVFSSYSSRRSLDSTSLPSSPLHSRECGSGSGNAAAERRPSWRLKFDAGCKFKLEDASNGTTFPPNNSTIIPSAPAVIAAANLSSATPGQRRLNSVSSAINTSNQSLNSIGRPISAPSNTSVSGSDHSTGDRTNDSGSNSLGTYISRRAHASTGTSTGPTAGRSATSGTASTVLAPGRTASSSSLPTSTSSARTPSEGNNTILSSSNTSLATSNTATNTSDDKDNDKENDNRSAIAAQAVIQRRRKPKRRSTGVVHLDMDDLDPERHDSANDTEEKESGSERSSRTRLTTSTSAAPASTSSSATDDRKSRDTSENGEAIDYKALWEAVKLENDKLKQQLKKKDDEVGQTRATLERFTNATTKNSLSEIEKRERRAMERKLSEMEEELKQLEVYKTENQRLKEENGALIRVISKLSK